MAPLDLLSSSHDLLMTSSGMQECIADCQIGSVFASLSNEKAQTLPPRFRDLKRVLIGDADNQARLIASWSRLTSRLAEAASDIEKRQQAAVPVLSYDELVSGDASAIARFKECGTAVVTGVVPEETASRWLADVEAYVAANPEVKGFPADDKQVFEVYWSRPQLEARAHPRAMAVQRALLNLFSGSDGPAAKLPLSYADRLRVRHPGDSRFALGPHMDGGSVERWEDPAYRAVYRDILAGKWERFDPFELGARARANQNLYDGPGACGVFRAFQGWTSLSNTGPGEGTLRVYPRLRELTAYTLLRPLFRALKSEAELGREAYLAPDNWALDTLTSDFPNAPQGRSQEFNDETHPHLQLARTMVSIPHVKPGDQAWWHADVIHAVESQHKGTGPSAVMYIPSVPMTPLNAAYVADQRDAFRNRIPPPDFPGGVGESQFRGTGTPDDVKGTDARRGMGLEAFEVSDTMPANERAVVEACNKILGF